MARVHSTPQRPFPFSHRLVRFPGEIGAGGGGCGARSDGLDGRRDGAARGGEERARRNGKCHELAE
eukprot:7515400-Pyramimonas_sp.AAC.1